MTANATGAEPTPQDSYDSPWKDALAELEASSNPFAVLVAAHLATQDTRNDQERRRDAKIDLIRSMHGRGLSPLDILRLFRLVDWMLRLEPPHALQFLEKLRQYEQEDHVPYISSVEQSGIEKGLKQGLEHLQQAALSILLARFGTQSTRLEDSLRAVESAERLEELSVKAACAATLEEFEAWLQAECG